MDFFPPALPIPSSLGFLLDNAAASSPMHTDRNWTLCVGKPLSILKEISHLPGQLSKLISTSEQLNIEKAGLKPLTEALTSSKLQSLAEKLRALEINKIILRYVYDDFLLQKSTQEFIFGSFVCQTALTNSLLKDEIYYQLLSHAIENRNESALRRVWTLLANLMGVAAPSADIFNYVLKQASEHGYEQYKALCQHILLNSSLHNRLYPPSTLEWKVNAKCAKPALEIRFVDNKSIIIGVGSFTTTEEVARFALRCRLEMAYDFAGWCVMLKHNSRQVECGGHGYIFDLISSMEMPPGWSEVTRCVLEECFLISDSTQKSVARTNVTVDFEKITHNEVPNNEQEQHYSTPDLNRWLQNVSDPILLNYSANGHQQINNNYFQSFINGGGGIPMNKSHQNPLINQFNRTNELKAALESEKLETALLEQSLQKAKLQKELARIQTEDQIQVEVPHLTTNNIMNKIKPTISAEFQMEKVDTQNSSNLIKEKDNSIKISVDNEKAVKIDKFKWPPESETNTSPEKPKIGRIVIEELNLNSKNAPLGTVYKNIQPGITAKPKVIALDNEKKSSKSTALTNGDSKIDVEVSDKMESNINKNKVNVATESIVQVAEKPQSNVSKLAKKMEGLLVLQMPMKPTTLKENTNNISAPTSSAPPKVTTIIVSDLKEGKNVRHSDQTSPPSPLPLPPSFGTDPKVNPLQIEDKNDTVDYAEIKRTLSTKLVKNLTLPPVPIVPAPPTPIGSISHVVGRSATTAPATKLHTFNNAPHYMYTLVRWTLVIRKEVFLPTEKLETPQLINLLFCQIVLDIYATSCIRLDSADRCRITSFLLSKGIDRKKSLPEILVKEPYQVKKQVIDLAKSTPFYFSRNFACTWWNSKVETAQQPKSIESAVHWLSVSHSGIRLAYQSKSNALSDEHLTCQHHIAYNDISDIIVNDIRVIIFITKSHQFKLHCEYAVEAKVMIEAYILDYFKYLEFPENQEVSYLREEDNTSWLALSNISVASPRFSTILNDFQTNDTFSMAEYASKYFRKAREHNFTAMICKQLVQWSRQLEHGSFRKLSSPSIEKLAVDCHLAVMAFMYDYPLPRDTEDIDRIDFLLKHAKTSTEISDEIYIVLCKQTTNNNSPDHNSLIRGWILFSIVAAHCNCSSELRPYVTYYIQQNQNNGWSRHTYYNFIKSIEYGSRRELPRPAELRALSNGCSEKRLRIKMPGKLENIIHISPCAITREVVEQLCEEFGVVSQLHQSEYGLVYLQEQDRSCHSLLPDEYLFDVMSMNEGGMGQFYFVRISWFASLQLESYHSSLLQFLFFQIQEKYLTGHWILPEHGSYFSPKEIDDVIQLAAVQMAAKRLSTTPNMKMVRDTLPFKVEQMCPEMTPQMWVDKVCAAYHSIQITSPPNYWIHFIYLVAEWQLFGSTTFMVSIRQPMHLNLNNETDVILSIGAMGLTFVHHQHRQCIARHSLNALQDVTCVEDNAVKISAKDYQRDRLVSYTILTNEVNKMLRVLNHHIKLNKLKDEF